MTAQKKEAKESKVDREIRELIEGEEAMLAETLGVDEPDWRVFLPREGHDSPGIRARKQEEFMITFILWRCGLWEPKEDEPIPSESSRAIRLDLARRTKAARS